jgi:hypothetical protein
MPKRIMGAEHPSRPSNRPSKRKGRMYRDFEKRDVRVSEIGFYHYPKTRRVVKGRF